MVKEVIQGWIQDFINRHSGCVCGGGGGGGGARPHLLGCYGFELTRVLVMSFLLYGVGV